MSGRWFHAHISGPGSEVILKAKGVDGTFLVRPSQSHPGNCTISVMHKNEVTHVKVLNDGDWFQLVSLDGTTSEPFATLNDLIMHCMKTPTAIPLKDGDYIELKLPLTTQDPTSERWFHGPLKGSEAEKLLLSKGTIGNFLVRESQSQPGQYVLTVRCQNGISHVIINNRHGKFDVGSGNQFDNLAELVMYYKENPQLRDKKSHSVINLEEPFHSTSFIAKNIEERMKQLSKQTNNRSDGFSEEFERLQYLDMKQAGYSKKEGERPENKTKNRYKNILPYDHSRVKIRDFDSNDVGSDYINANYVDSELKESHISYIAAQGCLPSTIATFWKMIYQENCRILVMLTNEVERGKAKCARYWPSVGMSVEFGNFILDNMLEHDKDDYIVRELRLYPKDQDDEPPRMIYHYHFTKWPDHGAPDDAESVLDLLDDVYAQHVRSNRTGPLVFHCSAGIGRTGTVIVIDVLIHLIEEQGLMSDIDVQKTTQLLRTKRPGMIQTHFQYKFVYKALETHIRRLLEIKETALSVTNPLIYENVGQAILSVNDRCMPRRPVPMPAQDANTPTDKSKGKSKAAAASTQDRNRKQNDRKHNTDPGKMKNAIGRS